MIAVTGASGKTGGKVAALLLKNGEKVRAIGRSREHLKSLADKGAETFIGDQGDPKFLTRAFTGADAAYVLIPPRMDAEDVREYYNTMGKAVVKAVKKSGLKKLVFLSSLGADQDAGTGPVLGLHDVEKALASLEKVDIVFLRAGYFYENTLMTLPLIRSKGVNSNAAAPDAPILMVSTRDIAEKAADLLVKRAFLGHSIEEIFGQRLSYRQVTETIREKIGLPDLAYVQAADQAAIGSMTGMGLSRSMAESFVELAHGISEGRVTATKSDPDKPNAPTRFVEFVEEEFLPAYKKAA